MLILLSLFTGSQHPSDNCGFDPLLGSFWTYKGWCGYTINRQPLNCFSHAAIHLRTNPLTFAVCPKSRPLAPSQVLNLTKNLKAFCFISPWITKCQRNSLNLQQHSWFKKGKKNCKSTNSSSSPSSQREGLAPPFCGATGPSKVK